MNARLAALLGASAVIGTAALFLVLRPSIGITLLDDGGVVADPNCASILQQCDVFLPPAGIAGYGLPISGSTALDAGTYASVLVRGYSCSDGGVSTPLVGFGSMAFNPSLCSTVACTLAPALCAAPPGQVEAAISLRPSLCACSDGTAGCLWTPPLPGGGFGVSTVAPQHVTLPAGSWAGTCVRKSCGEVAGFVTSWPATGCP